MRANTGLGKSRHDRLLRPPGALDETDFLSRCIRCGECMKVCPNNPLHPTLDQAGLEACGRRRWCRASAIANPVACCAPKFARRALSGRSPPRKRAGWWTWARAAASRSAWEPRSTTVAAACPGPRPRTASCVKSGARLPKAIYVEDAEVIDSAGKTKTLKQPRVDPEPLRGCGACEYACPLQERPAVYVQALAKAVAQQSDSADRK